MLRHVLQSRLREEKGITQERLAVDSDVSFNQIGRIERGEIEAKINMVNKIASGLNINTSQLFDFE
jgi:transcriptional regulator with XRE-family HTH domain